MSTTAPPRRDGYVLGRTPAEYERLRAQARVWEAATGRLLDQVELAPGSRCLDAGCGPGETMRLLAQRVGPSGRVLGVDVDAALGAQALAMLHAAGHLHCSFAPVDLERDATGRRRARSTSSTPACCCSTSPTRSPRWRGCGTGSPPAAISSCRTTTCAPVA